MALLRSVVCLGVGFCSSWVYGQTALPMVPIQHVGQPVPYAGTTVPPMGTPMLSPTPQPLIPPNYEAWRDGFEESWIHRYRPLNRLYDNGWQNADRYQHPVYVPQNQPVYQYQYPQYQTSTYCVPQNYYYHPQVYRQPSCLWPF